MPVVTFPTGNSTKPYVDTDLDIKELAAIGFVTVQWGSLENTIYEYTKVICQSVHINIPEHAESDSFKRRFKLFRRLVNEYAPQEEKDRIAPFLSMVDQLKVDRHKVTHGLWDWEQSNPNKLRSSSNRGRFSFEKGFNIDKLVELATRIGEAHYGIAYPNGKEDVYATKITATEGEPSYGISRHLARILSGQTDHLPPEIRATLLKDNKPLDASEG